jgi:hypothetical protein
MINKQSGVVISCRQGTRGSLITAYTMHRSLGDAVMTNALQSVTAAQVLQIFCRGPPRLGGQGFPGVCGGATIMMPFRV